MTKQRKFSKLEEAMGWELFTIHCPKVAALQNTIEHPPMRWIREGVNGKSSYAQIQLDVPTHYPGRVRALNSEASKAQTRLHGYEVNFWVEKTAQGRTLQEVKVWVKTQLLDESHTIYKQWEDDVGLTTGDLETEAQVNGILAFVDWYCKRWMLGRYGR